MISSAFLPMGAHPFAWIPSNITAATLVALTRNLTSGSDSLDTDTPVVAPPGTNKQFGSPPYATILIAAGLLVIVAGMALLVIIRRRIKLEEQEAEEDSQVSDEDKNECMFKLLDKLIDWREQLRLPSWSKEHDLIQL